MLNIEDHQSNDGHHRAQSNGYPDAQEPLPPRASNGPISQDPNRPPSYEYSPQPAARDDRLEHVRGLSSGNPGGLYAAQQQQQSATASSPTNEHRRVQSN